MARSTRLLSAVLLLFFFTAVAPVDAVVPRPRQPTPPPPQPTQAPPIPPGVHVVDCEYPYEAFADPKMCTPGAEVNADTKRCECVQEGYACDVRSGRCRKLAANVDTGGGAKPIEIFGFLLLIGLVLFCLGNLVFYQKNSRLPYWVKNSCCTCPPEPSCEDLSKNKKQGMPGGIGKKKNPIDELSAKARK